VTFDVNIATPWVVATMAGVKELTFVETATVSSRGVTELPPACEFFCFYVD
jgi:hypothetical protein